MDGIMLGLAELFQPSTLIALFFGTILGLIVGSLPGLNDSITMAVLIPITFGMSANTAMGLLIGIYCASACGGSIPAILLKIPGTASAAVTSTDGYPMAQSGRAGEALGIATASSTFGGITSAIVLLFLSPFLAAQALRFGPPEYFMLAVMGMSTVIGMDKDKMGKNLLAMCFGLLISCIGMSTQTGRVRFIFGQYSLLDGVSLVPMLIGLFGITSIMELIESIRNAPKIETAIKGEKVTVRVKLPDAKMTKRLLPIWAQSSAIGNVIGIIPGAGMIMAIYMAYDQARRRRPRLPWGQGIEEGIAAPEAANNAVVASSMVPLLSLGVPGNSTSALFLGALTIQGLKTGPGLFNDTPEMAYMIILGFLLSNLIMLPMCVLYTNVLATAVLRLKREILSGIVLALCVTGAFAISNNIFNIWVIIFFGIVGYFFNKYKIPQSSLILATILGEMMESNYLQSLVYTGGIDVFFKRPLSLGLLIISIAFIVSPFLGPVLKKLRGKKAA